MSTLLHQLQIFYTGCIKVNVSDLFDQLAEVMEVHGVHQRWKRASVSCWKFVVLCYSSVDSITIGYVCFCGVTLQCLCRHGVEQYVWNNMMAEFIFLG